MLFDSGLGIACRLKAAAKSPAPAKKSWMEDSPALCAPSHADPDIMNKNAILISVGASAWSEELPDTTFTEWFQKNFSDAHEAWPPGLPWRNINQRLVQQNEFVTAAGHRPGLNPLCKPFSALDEDTKLRLGSKQPVGGGVLKLSIRQVPWTQDSDAVYMGRKSKFWMVRRMSCVVRITPVLRSNDMRSACTPSTMFGSSGLFSDAAEGRKILMHIENALTALQKSTLLGEEKRKQGKLSGLLMNTWVESLDTYTRNKTSTSSNFAKPGGGMRILNKPADVIASECVCATLQKFPEWLHFECKGSASFLVTPNTQFKDETEVNPTVMHAMKAEVLATLRTNPVSQKNIIRGVISEEVADMLRVAGDASGLSGTPDEVDFFATDKHKIIWLVPTHYVRALAHVTQRLESPAPAPTKGQGKGTKGQAAHVAADEEAALRSIFLGLKTNAAVAQLWEYGSLHITKSAPKSHLGRWKLTFAPPASGHFGDFVCIVMDWVGNYLFYHECMRRAATKGLHTGPLIKLFTPNTSDRSNALHGLLSDQVLAQYEGQMRFTFDQHQRRALQYMNDATTDTAFFVRALAGVGKTAISSVIQFACTQHYTMDPVTHADSCVVVLYPTRELREDLAREALAQSLLQQDQLMWLGRPARETSTLPMWDEHAERLIKEHLERNGVLATLQSLQTNLKDALCQMKNLADAVNPDVQWNFMNDFFLHEGSFASTAVDDYVRASVLAKTAAQDYLNTEVRDVINARTSIVEEIVRGVKVVLATADAWCKLQAGQSSGISKTAISQKQIQVLIMDEAQSYIIPTVLAACYNAATVVFFGDENQSIDFVQPSYTRTPWVSVDNPYAICKEELNSVDCDDETQGVATSVWPAAGSSSDSREPSSIVPITRINPRRRWFTEYFSKNQTILELPECKRCGPQVTDFCCRMFKWCEKAKFNSSGCAPNTQLYHYFYETVWEDWRADDARVLFSAAPATWNTCLFFAIMAVAFKELEEIVRTARASPVNPGQPLILIVCYLQRIAVPLQKYAEAMMALPSWLGLCKQTGHPTPIQVCSVDAIRGLSAEMVHWVHARRFVTAWDQYHGIQSDDKREYICYTRGRRSTTSWLECTHGTPEETKPDTPNTKGGAELSAARFKAIKEMKLPWRVLKQDGSLPRFVREQLAFLEVPGDVLNSMSTCTYNFDTPDHSKTLDKSTYRNVLCAVRGLVTGDEHCQAFALETLHAVRDAGIEQATARPTEIHDAGLSEQGRYTFKVACRLGFAVPELVVSLYPGSQLVQLCIPVLVAPGVETFGSRGDSVEEVFRSFIHVVKRVHEMVWGDGEDLLPCVRLHKAEVQHVMGFAWWSKACESDRQAVVLANENLTKRKQQRVYMYLGGGSLSAESTWDLQGIVVRCKTWNLAISVALSVLVVTACSPGWHPVRLSKDTLIWTPEKADNVLESDSDADDVDDDKTPNTFIGLYETALERLLASTA